MARHRKTNPPAPAGLKAFYAVLGVLVVTSGAVLTGGLVKDSDSKQPERKDAVVQTTTTAPTPKTTPSPKASPTPTFFPDCQAAKEAGALPLKRGEPGYLPQFDLDGDGTACEGV